MNLTHVCCLAVALIGVLQRPLLAQYADISDAASSPYDIAHFVDTHRKFEWEPLWEALAVEHPPFLQPCEDNGTLPRECSEEMLTVLDPFQVILLLRRNVGIDNSEAEVYLQFKRHGNPNSSGQWEFKGFYQPPVKYFPPRHEIIRFGSKPFLLVTRQGAAGSGLSSEVQDWLDLTTDKFESVFELTTRGNLLGSTILVDIDVQARVENLEFASVERIRVSYSADYSADQKPLAARSHEVVYSRQNGRFVFDATRSEASGKEIADLYDVHDIDLSKGSYLRYFLPELKAIAADPKSAQRRWLLRVLVKCRNSAEKQEILKAFHSATARQDVLRKP